MKRAICFLPENQPQDLDHLLPLAIELDLPVITRSEKKRDLALHYYPDVNLEWVSPSYPLDQLRDGPVVISTLPRYELELALFLEKNLYGSYDSIFCHHGLSDKQLQGNQFKNLHADHKALIYGKKDQKEIPPHCTTFCVGNYRKHHFEKHQDLYRFKCESALKKLDSSLWTLLFTPSWIMKNIHHGFTIESLASFLESSLLDSIPKNMQVIFKPHPYLTSQIPETLEKIKAASETIPNLLYLEEIPYIYPLFEKVDAYLGEVSSIGYDFLTTSKPIFTLSKEIDSPWQKIAMKAPLKECCIDWKSLYNQTGQWDPQHSLPLLEESFATSSPLHLQRDAFFEFIQANASFSQN